MNGKVEITLNDERDVLVKSELEGQGLYEAYVGFTAHIASKLKDRNDIVLMSEQAARDALKMIDKQNLVLIKK